MHPISLRDCEISHTPATPSYKGHQGVYINLPGIINISRIPYQKRHQADHLQYPNEFGSLYLACDGHAGFWPPVYRGRNLTRFNFESVERTGVEFKEFQLTDDDTMNPLFFDGMDREEILRALQSNAELGGFFYYFFNWINQFREQYGDAEHFHQPSQVY